MNTKYLTTEKTPVSWVEAHHAIYATEQSEAFTHEKVVKKVFLMGQFYRLCDLLIHNIKNEGKAGEDENKCPSQPFCYQIPVSIVSGIRVFWAVLRYVLTKED